MMNLAEAALRFNCFMCNADIGEPCRSKVLESPGLGWRCGTHPRRLEQGKVALYETEKKWNR